MISLSVYINILPYMKNINRLQELMKQWTGGIEIVMDGAHWSDNLIDWNKEYERFQYYPNEFSVHTPIFELNLASFRYPTIASYSFEVYQQSILWAAKIGAKHAVVHSNLPFTPIHHRKEAQRISKNYMKKLGELGNRLGVKVLIENVGFHNNMLFDEREFIELFEEIPSVDALIDVGHAHINKWNTSKVIWSLGERLKGVHLHDNGGEQDEHLPIGKGTIKWDIIWAALNELQHDFLLTLEYDIDTSTNLLMEHTKLVRENIVKLGLIQ